MAINFSRLEDISKALIPLNESGRSFHTTFVYRGNKLLTIGINNYQKSHKRHIYGEYKSTRNQGNYEAGCHGELAAIIRLGLDDCSGLKFINVRINRNGQPSISKPCVNCERIMRQLLLKEIWYFDGEKYVKEKY